MYVCYGISEQLHNISDYFVSVASGPRLCSELNVEVESKMKVNGESEIVNGKWHERRVLTN
jgi:hypothetical protein